MDAGNGGELIAAPVWKTGAFGAILLVVGVPGAAGAQESTNGEHEAPPYFVTYSDHLEEKGELDVELFSTVADPGNGNRVSVDVPPGAGSDRIRLAITAVDGRSLIAAETTMK